MIMLILSHDAHVSVPIHQHKIVAIAQSTCCPSHKGSMEEGLFSWKGFQRFPWMHSMHLFAF